MYDGDHDLSYTLHVSKGEEVSWLICGDAEVDHCSCEAIPDEL